MSNLLQSGCSLLTQNSQYLLLFALSLLYILLYKKGIINRLGILLTTLLLLIYCPLTAAIIGKYQTNFYDRGNMGVMLPLIPLIGYAVTGIFYIFIDKCLSGKNKLCTSYLLDCLFLFLYLRVVCDLCHTKKFNLAIRLTPTWSLTIHYHSFPLILTISL